MRGLGLGQEWDQDQRSNANEREWEVTNKGQWLVRNVGVIRVRRKRKKKVILSQLWVGVSM